MKDIMIKWAELGLVSDGKNANKTYGWKKTGNSQLDVAQFIKGNPPWSNVTYIENNQRKKIIANYWQCLFPLPKEDLKLWAYLFDNGFTIWVYTIEGRLEEIKSLSQLGRFFFINVVSNEMLSELICSQGEEASDYLIVDTLTRKQLCKELHPYFNYKESYIESVDDRLDLTSDHCPLSIDQQDLIQHLVIMGHITRLRYTYQWGNEFEWEMTGESASKILRYLGNEETYNALPILQAKLSPYLTSIKISNNLTDSMDVSDLVHLKKLHIDSPRLTFINGLSKLTQLEKLKLTFCCKLTSLNVSILANLKSLTVKHCDRLTIDGFHHHAKLQELSVEDSKLPNLSNASSLIKLKIKYTQPKKNNVDEINALLNAMSSQLENLDLSLRDDTSKINLGSLTRLRKLSLSYGSIVERSNLIIDVTCESIEELKVTNVKRVDLSHCVNLKKLDVNLADHIDNMEACSKLQDITVQRFYSPSTFSAHKFKHIRKIKFEYFDIDIKGLGQNDHMEEIVIGNSKTIYSIDVSGLKQLRHLVVYDCKKLSSIQGLDGNSLETLSIVDCPSLVTDNFQKLPLLNFSIDVCPMRFPPRKVKNNNIQCIQEVSSDGADKQCDNKLSKKEFQEDEAVAEHESNQGAETKDLSINLPLDTETKTSKDKKVKVSRIFINENDPASTPDPIDYRLYVLDKVRVTKEGKIDFYAGFNLENREKVDIHSKTQHENEENSVTGTFSLMKGVSEHILPGLSSGDELISLTDAANFNIYRSLETSQYILQLNGSSSSAPEVITFLIKPAPGYHTLGCIDAPSKKSEVPLLPVEIKSAIEQSVLLANYPKVSKIIKALEAAENDHARIKLLVNYCHFENNSLSSHNFDDITGLMNIMEERRGSCRHSAMVFMILSHYFGIPTRIVTNQCHAFIEVAVNHENTLSWAAIDLGGSDTDVIIRDYPFHHPIKSSEKPPENADVLDEALCQALLNDEHWSQCGNHVSLMAKIITHQKAVLIRVPQQSDAWRWHAFIVDHLAHLTGHIESVFVNSAEEMRSLFETSKIDNNSEVIIPGPLKKLIQNNHGVLMINWSNFNATERAIYKSVMDTPPTLHGEPIKSGIQIIGFMSERIQVNDVFLSRCDEISDLSFTLALTNDAYPKRDWLIEEGSPGKPREGCLSVNLFHSPDWSRFLVEDISIQGDRLTVKMGPLVRAMKMGLTIIIQQAPFSEPTFQRFWHSLTAENKILFNGELIPMHEDCKIILQEKCEKLQQPSCLDFEESPSKGKSYYITRENYYQLFDMNKITQNDRIHTINGLLARYQPGEKFVVQDQLNEDQWQRLYGFLLNAYEHQSLSKIKFYIDPTFNKNVAVTNHAACTITNSHNLNVTSNDPYFVVQMIKKTMGLSPKNIFYLATESAWSTLIEDVVPYRAERYIRAKRHDLPFWKKLQKGKTVILCGHLTKSDYTSLQTLYCHPPHLYVNGRRVRSHGQLIWVHAAKTEAYSNPSLPSYAVNVSVSDYEKQLRREIKYPNEELIKCLNFLFSIFSKLAPETVHYKTNELYTYSKYRSLYRNISFSGGRSDVIKPLLTYHYHKGEEQYAFINTVIKGSLIYNKKCLVSQEKLINLLSNVHSKADFMRYFWRISNCFNSGAINKVNAGYKLRSDVNTIVPHPTKQMKKAVMALSAQYDTRLYQQGWLKKDYHSLFHCQPTTKKENRFFKQQSRLIAAFRDKTKPIIYLLGESGTGKTSSVKAVLKKAFHIKKIYVGEQDIVHWLQSDGRSNRVLLLDEINLRKTLTWEFLRGISDGIVYYQGNKYKLTQNHKIIGTGNPSHYTGRYHHPILFDMAHVIWYGPFQVSFIEEKVKKYLSRMNLPIPASELDAVTAILVKSYDYLRHHVKSYTEVTLRDMQNSCVRIAILKSHSSNASWSSLTSQAIYEETVGIVKNEKERNKFKSFLHDEGSQWEESSMPHLLPTDLIIPPEKQDVWRMIMDDILLRKRRIESGHHSIGKLGLLLVGPSGIGKSAFLTKALELSRFSCDAQDTQKKYYQITAGSDNVRETLLRAFNEGSLVILDELNLGDELEILLNQLLTGVDMQQKPAAKPGFMLLSTQNPPHYAGCKLISPALINRVHVINMSDYNQEELKYIAFKRHHPKPDALVQSFFHLRKTVPSMNSRKFFHVLNEGTKMNI